MVNYLTLLFGFMASLFHVVRISAFCVVLHFDFHFVVEKYTAVKVTLHTFQKCFKETSY